MDPPDADATDTVDSDSKDTDRRRMLRGLAATDACAWIAVDLWRVKAADTARADTALAATARLITRRGVPANDDSADIEAPRSVVFAPDAVNAETDDMATARAAVKLANALRPEDGVTSADLLRVTDRVADIPDADDTEGARKRTTAPDTFRSDVDEMETGRRRVASADMDRLESASIDAERFFMIAGVAAREDAELISAPRSYVVPELDTANVFVSPLLQVRPV